MGERYTRPATADNVGWNTTPTNPSNDPGGAVRAAGWPPNSVPGSDEFNYLQTMWGDFFQYVEAMIVRTWNEIPEGLAVAEIGDIFRVVYQDDGSAYERLREVFSVVAGTTGGGNPSHICTDSNRVFFIAGTSQEYLAAVSPITGALDWEVRPSSGNAPSALCCDGGGIYYTYGAVNNGLYRRDPDGTTETSAGANRQHFALRSNSEYVVGIGGSSGAGDLEIWVANPVAAHAIGTTGSAALSAVAIDQTQCYGAGTRAATKDVWAYTLSTGALAWSVQLDANAPSIQALAADGDHVYVLTNSYALATGPTNQALFCLDRITGLLLWSTIVDGTHMAMLAVDHKYIYVVNSNDDLYQMPKGRIEPGLLAKKLNVTSSLDCDGASVWARDGATATKLRRVSSGEHSVNYFAAKSDDPNRRPWAKLAIPA